MTYRSLFDVHSTLSRLIFAVDQALEPFCVDVSVEYHKYTHIAVKVECYVKDRQAIVDRLNHGVLQGDFDYRFKVSYPTGGQPLDWITVSGYPDMQHDSKVLK